MTTRKPVMTSLPAHHPVGETLEVKLLSVGSGKDNVRNLRRQLNEERARHVIELKDQRLRLLKVTEPQAVARNCNLRQERERVVAEQRDVLAKKHQTENTQQERLRLAQEQRLTKELQRLQSQLQKARENKGLSGEARANFDAERRMSDLAREKRTLEDTTARLGDEIRQRDQQLRAERERAKEELHRTNRKQELEIRKVLEELRAKDRIVRNMEKAAAVTAGNYDRLLAEKRQGTPNGMRSGSLSSVDAGDEGSNDSGLSRSASGDHEAQQEILELTAKLETFEKECEKLNSENDSLLEKVEQLENVLKPAKERHKQLEVELNTMKKQYCERIKSLSEENEDLKAEISNQVATAMSNAETEEGHESKGLRLRSRNQSDYIKEIIALRHACAEKDRRLELLVARRRIQRQAKIQHKTAGLKETYFGYDDDNTSQADSTLAEDDTTEPPQHLLEANYQRLVREHMKLEKSYAELCGTEGSTQSENHCEVALVNKNEGYLDENMHHKLLEIETKLSEKKKNEEDLKRQLREAQEENEDLEFRVLELEQQTERTTRSDKSPERPEPGIIEGKMDDLKQKLMLLYNSDMAQLNSDGKVVVMQAKMMLELAERRLSEYESSTSRLEARNRELEHLVPRQDEAQSVKLVLEHEKTVKELQYSKENLEKLQQELKDLRQTKDIYKYKEEYNNKNENRFKEEIDHLKRKLSSSNEGRPYENEIFCQQINRIKELEELNAKLQTARMETSSEVHKQNGLESAGDNGLAKECARSVEDLDRLGLEVAELRKAREDLALRDQELQELLQKETVLSGHYEDRLHALEHENRELKEQLDANLQPEVNGYDSLDEESLNDSGTVLSETDPLQDQSLLDKKIKKMSRQSGTLLETIAGLRQVEGGLRRRAGDVRESGQSRAGLRRLSQREELERCRQSEQNLKERVEVMEANEKLLRTRAAELEEALDQAKTASVKTLENDVESMKAKLEEKTNNESKLFETVYAKELELQEMQEHVELLQRELHSTDKIIPEELEQLNKEVNNSEQPGVNKLMVKLASIEADDDEHGDVSEKQVKELKVQLAKKEDQISSLSKRVRLLEGIESIFKKKLEDKNMVIAQLDDNEAKLKEDLESSEDRVKKLENEISVLKKREANLMDELDEFEENTSKLENDIKVLRSRNNSESGASDKMEQLEKRNNDLNEQLKDLQSSNNMLRKRTGTFGALRDGTEIQELNKKLKLSVENEQTLRAKIRRTEEAEKALRDSNSNLVAQLKQQSESIAKQHEIGQEKESRLDTLQKALEEKEHANKELQFSLHSLQDKFRNSSNILEELQHYKERETSLKQTNKELKTELQSLNIQFNDVDSQRKSNKEEYNRSVQQLENSICELRKELKRKEGEIDEVLRAEREMSRKRDNEAKTHEYNIAQMDKYISELEQSERELRVKVMQQAEQLKEQLDKGETVTIDAVLDHEVMASLATQEDSQPSKQETRTITCCYKTKVTTLTECLQSYRDVLDVYVQRINGTYNDHSADKDLKELKANDIMLREELLSLRKYLENEDQLEHGEQCTAQASSAQENMSDAQPQRINVQKTNEVEKEHQKHLKELMEQLSEKATNKDDVIKQLQRRVEELQSTESGLRDQLQAQQLSSVTDFEVSRGVEIMFDSPETILKQRLKTLETTETNLRVQVSEIERDREELHQLAREDKSIIHELNVQLRELTLKEKHLKDRIQSLEKSETQLQLKSDAQNEENTDLELQLKQRKCTEKELSRKLRLAEERQEDLNNQLQNAAVECSMVENTLKKRQSELEQNKAAMDAKQAELVEHEAAEMDLRRRLSLVETESKDKLHELEACNETLSKRNEELESRIEDILQKTHCLEEEKATLVYDAAENDVDRKDALEQAANLKLQMQQLQDSEIEIDALNSQLKEVKEREHDLNEEARLRIESAQQKVDDVTQDAVERSRVLRARIDELVDENESNQQKVADLQQDNESLKVQLHLLSEATIEKNEDDLEHHHKEVQATLLEAGLQPNSIPATTSTTRSVQTNQCNQLSLRDVTPELRRALVNLDNRHPKAYQTFLRDLVLTAKMRDEQQLVPVQDVEAATPFSGDKEALIDKLLTTPPPNDEAWLWNSVELRRSSERSHEEEDEYWANIESKSVDYDDMTLNLVISEEDTDNSVKRSRSAASAYSAASESSAPPLPTNAAPREHHKQKDSTASESVYVSHPRHQGDPASEDEASEIEDDGYGTMSASRLVEHRAISLDRDVNQSATSYPFRREKDVTASLESIPDSGVASDRQESYNSFSTQDGPRVVHQRNEQQALVLRIKELIRQLETQKNVNLDLQQQVSIKSRGLSAREQELQSLREELESTKASLYNLGTSSLENTSNVTDVTKLNIPSMPFDQPSLTVTTDTQTIQSDDLPSTIPNEERLLWEQHLEDAKNNAESLQKQLHDSQRRVNDLETSSDGLRGELEQMNDRVKQLDALLKEKEESPAASFLIDKLEVAADTKPPHSYSDVHTKDLELLEREQKQLKDLVRALEDEIAQKREAETTLYREISDLRHENARLAKAVGEQSDYLRRSRDLQDRLQELHNSGNLTQNVVDPLRSKLQTYCNSCKQKINDDNMPSDQPLSPTTNRKIEDFDQFKPIPPPSLLQQLLQRVHLAAEQLHSPLQDAARSMTSPPPQASRPPVTLLNGATPKLAEAGTLEDVRWRDDTAVAPPRPPLRQKRISARFAEKRHSAPLDDAQFSLPVNSRTQQPLEPHPPKTIQHPAFKTSLTSVPPVAPPRALRKQSQGHRPLRQQRRSELDQNHNEPTTDVPAPPRNLSILRPVGDHSLLIGWRPPSMDELGRSNNAALSGYLLSIDSRYSQTIHSPYMCKAIVEHVDLGRSHEVTLQTMAQGQVLSEPSTVNFEPPHKAVDDGSSEPEMSSLFRGGKNYPEGHRKLFLAVYDYDPEEQSPRTDTAGELTLRTGDPVVVYGTPRGDGFYQAKVNGQKGLVPQSFVEEVALMRVKTKRVACDSIEDDVR